MRNELPKIPTQCLQLCQATVSQEIKSDRERELREEEVKCAAGSQTGREEFKKTQEIKENAEVFSGEE